MKSLFIFIAIFLAACDDGGPLRIMNVDCHSENACLYRVYWGGGGAAGWSDYRMFILDKTASIGHFAEEKPILKYYDGCHNLRWEPDNVAHINICAIELQEFGSQKEQNYIIEVPEKCNVEVLKSARVHYLDRPPDYFQQKCQDMLAQ